MQGKHMVMALALLSLSVARAAVPAGQEKPACAVAVPVTGELSPWMHPLINFAAASDPGRAGHAGLSAGQAADVLLAPTRRVRFAMTPGKLGGQESYGGLLNLRIARAGTYRIGLSNSAWIDLVSGERAVPSIKNGPGPDCSGIHKLVDFQLQPGTYKLQVAASADRRLRIMAVQVP